MFENKFPTGRLPIKMKVCFISYDKMRFYGILGQPSQMFKILVPPFQFLYPQLYLPRGKKKKKAKISVDTVIGPL